MPRKVTLLLILTAVDDAFTALLLLTFLFFERSTSNMTTLCKKKFGVVNFLNRKIRWESLFWRSPRNGANVAFHLHASAVQPNLWLQGDITRRL